MSDRLVVNAMFIRAKEDFRFARWLTVSRRRRVVARCTLRDIQDFLASLILGSVPSAIKVSLVTRKLANVCDSGPHLISKHPVFHGPTAQGKVGLGSAAHGCSIAGEHKLIELVRTPGRQLPWRRQLDLGHLLATYLFRRDFHEPVKLLNWVTAGRIALDQSTQDRLAAVPLVLAVERAGDAQQPRQVSRVVAADLRRNSGVDVLDVLGLG